jgi:hypothetical protein
VSFAARLLAIFRRPEPAPLWVRVVAIQIAKNSR